MLSETGYNRYLEDSLTMHMANVLASMEGDTELFETLLCSYPNRLHELPNWNSNINAQPNDYYHVKYKEKK